MRLVVLDDDEAIGTFVATVARNRGWQAEAITDESEFQRLVRASPPAAIVLDLQLHASDGVEQLRFLHAVGYRGRIVLISGFDARVLASAQQIGSALGLAIVAVISKPARAAQVHDVLAMVERAPSAAPLAPAAAPVPPAISAGDVAAAIDAGQMELHLQPIVSLPKRAVTHAEGLVRWRDPILGLVPPEQFIPAAETDDAIIDQLTMWVAQSGATHYRRLVDLGHNVQVRINISGHSLRSIDFPDRLAALLARHGAPADSVGIEITESVAMHDPQETAGVVTRLRLKGFSVALDDFGTGHSSLTALRQLPFSGVKIDKSFVGEIETSHDSLAIVRSVINLARDLDLECVAEGVGSAAVAQKLTDLGISGLQGHYFSPPLPFAEFVAWLDRWHDGGRH